MGSNAEVEGTIRFGVRLMISQSFGSLDRYDLLSVKEGSRWIILVVFWKSSGLDGDSGVRDLYAGMTKVGNGNKRRSDFRNME